MIFSCMNASSQQDHDGHEDPDEGHLRDRHIFSLCTALTPCSCTLWTLHDLYLLWVFSDKAIILIHFNRLKDTKVYRKVFLNAENLILIFTKPFILRRQIFFIGENLYWFSRNLWFIRRKLENVEMNVITDGRAQVTSLRNKRFRWREQSLRFFRANTVRQTDPLNGLTRFESPIRFRRESVTSQQDLPRKGTPLREPKISWNVRFECLGHSNWTICSLLSQSCFLNFQIFHFYYWEFNWVWQSGKIGGTPKERETKIKCPTTVVTLYKL